MEFNLYRTEGDSLMEVFKTFKYLGKPLNQAEDDWMVVQYDQILSV